MQVGQYLIGVGQVVFPFQELPECGQFRDGTIRFIRREEGYFPGE
jgi:hypothetical protein